MNSKQASGGTGRGKRGLMSEVRLQSPAPNVAAESGEKILFSGITAQRVQIRPGARFDYSWCGDVHYLAFHDIVLERGQIFVGKQGASEHTDLRGALTFIPAATKISGWSAATERLHSFTALYLNPRKMTPELSAHVAAVADQPDIYFSNPALQSTLRKLHHALISAKGIDRLYAESLGLTAAIELCRFRSQRNRTSALAVSTESLERVNAYIEAHLASEITLEQLAAEARLSPFHFIRAFKRDVGTTPYQHVLRRRIERSQSLLVTGRYSVQEVATLVGFSSAAHFIRVFRAQVGATPGQLMAAARIGRR